MRCAVGRRVLEMETKLAGLIPPSARFSRWHNISSNNFHQQLHYFLCRYRGRRMISRGVMKLLSRSRESSHFVDATPRHEISILVANHLASLLSPILPNLIKAHGYSSSQFQQTEDWQVLMISPPHQIRALCNAAVGGFCNSCSHHLLALASILPRIDWLWHLNITQCLPRP